MAERADPARRANPLADARFTRFTDWEGSEEGAEISPDGEFVVFLSDRSGQFDIWQSRVGTGVFSNLTADLPPLTSSGFIVRKLGFSADGRDLWFNPGDGLPPTLMPATGGVPRPFLRPAPTRRRGLRPATASSTSTSPTATTRSTSLIAFGGDAHAIFGPGPLKNMNPVWSPDGQWIYFARGLEPQDETEMDVWRFARPADRLSA